MRRIGAALKSHPVAHGLSFEAGNSLEALLELKLVAVLQPILVLEKACVRCWCCYEQYHWFGLDRLDLAKESVTCLKSERKRC